MISNRVQNLEESVTTAAAQRASDLQEAGIDVISLTVGEPDFDTPKVVLDAANEAMYAGKGHHYTHTTGIPELRQAIADYHERFDDVKYDISEIAVSNGAKSILYDLFQVLLNEGDEVLLPVPYWVSYAEQIKLAGGRVVEVQTDPSNDYDLTVDMIKEKITSKTKMIVLNYPNNPSGAILTETQLRAIGEFCVENNIIILADEIYSRLIFDDFETVSMAAISEEIRNQTLIVNGSAKSHAMTGWRIGYVCGNEKIIKAVTKFASQSSGNPVGISQYASLAAYNDADEDIENLRLVFANRSQKAYDAMIKLPGFELNSKPHGAFYLFPDCTKAAKLAGYDTVDELGEAILEEANVATVPGSAFGMPNHIRFSYSTSEELFTEAMARINRFMYEKIG